MEIPKNWRLKQQRYSLVGEICPECGDLGFPPRDIGKCGHSIGSVTRDEALERTKELYKNAPEMKGAEAYWEGILVQIKAGTYGE